jgi:hypothetical protein
MSARTEPAEGDNQSISARSDRRYDVDENGCWLWRGGRFENGYAQIRYDGKTRRAHRVIYEVLVGPIQAGLVLDHLCRVRHCVNPDHLEVVTERENIYRGLGLAGINAAKTHCVNGHEFSPENTYYSPNAHRRSCRICSRDAQVRYKERKALEESI